MIDSATLRDANTKRVWYGLSEEELRVGISGLYYSLFHQLTWAGAGLISPDDETLRRHIARSYDHGPMFRLCSAYAKPPQTKPVSSLDRLVPIRNPFVVIVCEEFTLLQEQRHLDDYNLSATITSNEAIDVWQSSERAHAAWSAVEGSPDARVFLTALLLQEKWSRRG